MPTDSKAKMFGVLLLFIIIAIAFILMLQRLNPKISSAPTEDGSPTVAPPKQTENLTINLKEVFFSKEEGTAKLKLVQGGKTAIEINLARNGASSATSSAQPAYIRNGDCKNPGEIVTTLERLRNGRSTSYLVQSIDDLLKKEKLIITVHQNMPDQTLPITSCGELKKP